MRISERIDERTPADRDRYLDFLRVASILLVIVGHWLVRAVTVEDGRLEPGYMLALEPWTQWLTLIVQVLPIFFLVGGALNAQSWRRARRRDVRAVDWLRRRARRLLFPLIPLYGLWIAFAALLEATTWRTLTIFEPETAVIPAWFLAAYLVVTALTPATLRLHERAGGAWLIPVAAAAAIAIDIVRFTLWADGPRLGGQPAVGALNFPIVILAIHQLGYLWADDALPRRRHSQAMLALAAATALALMLGSRIYPLTMVPIAGTDAPNNLAPPSAALIALGLIQLGIALLLRPALSRWLARPRPWMVVAIPGAYLMTIFLWHQTAMLIVTAGAYGTSLWPATPEIGLSWWAARPPWILLCGLALLVLAAVFGGVESARPPALTRLSPIPAALVHGAGVLLTSGAITLFIASGLTDPAAPLGLPLLPMATLVAGLWALGVLNVRSERAPEPARSAGQHNGRSGRTSGDG